MTKVTDLPDVLPDLCVVITYLRSMRNIGSVDKVIRVLIAALISIFNYTHKINAFYSTALLLIATILLITSLVNVCPIYMILNISTRKKME